MWQEEPTGVFDFEDASYYCEYLSIAGRSDWRLATFNELKAIIWMDDQLARLTDDTKLWSSSESGWHDRLVLLPDGKGSRLGEHASAKVICVRSNR